MSIPIKRTLFVGLGGFGKAALHMLRRKFYESYGQWKVPAIEYLILDTDRSPLPVMHHSGIDTIDRLVSFRRFGPENPDGEFIDLSFKRADLEAVYQGHVVERVSRAMKWFDPRLKDLGAQVLEDGAAGIRSFGRMSFLLGLLHGHRGVDEAIQRKLIALRNLTSADESWGGTKARFSLDTQDQRVDVYVYFSTCGGTGSGIFLDVPYLIRELAQSVKVELADVSAYIFLHDILLDDPKLMATFRPPQCLTSQGLSPQTLAKSGTYAALTELERYQMSASPDFRFDAGWGGAEPFVAEWLDYEAFPGGQAAAERRFAGIRPFSWVHLIGRTSTAGDPLNGTEDAIEMASDKAFMLMVSRENGELLRTIRSNRAMFTLPEPIRTEAGPSSRYFSRNYGGFGLSKIYIGRSRIHRWAALYLADRFVAHLADAAEGSKSEAQREAEELLGRFRWTGKELFMELGENMLAGIGDRFAKLKSASDFRDLALLGTDSRPGAAAFGQAAELDLARETWVKRFNGKSGRDEFFDAIDGNIIDRGLRYGCQLLESLAEVIRSEIEIVRQDLEPGTDSLAKFSDLSKTWICAQSDRLLWLGEKNRPGSPRDVGNILVRAATDVAHLQELEVIGATAAARVREPLRARFRERFLGDICCASWRDELTMPGALRQTAQSLVNVQHGLVRSMKEVLTRVVEAQTRLLDTIIRLRGELLKDDSLATGTMSRVCQDLRKREPAGEHARATGIKAELADMERDADEGTRSIYCGAVYQNAESLKSPTPDPRGMAALMKLAFGGEERPLRWTWELIRVPELESRTQVWISMIVESPFVELTIEPTLNSYYESLTNRRSDTLRSNLDHILRRSSSYLRHRDAAIGAGKPPQVSKHLFVPNDLLAEVKDHVGANANCKVSGYAGEEIVALTVEDGIPIVLLESWDDLAKTFDGLTWPSAVWTRGGPPRLLTLQPRHSNRRSDVLIGILLGTIWYDRGTKEFKMLLAREPGAEQPTPIGKSIAEVVSFFEGRRHERFIDALPSLIRSNDARIMKPSMLRKSLALARYYEKYFFPEQDDVGKKHEPEDLSVIKVLLDYRKRMTSQARYAEADVARLNGEATRISSWMHAFCDLVPVSEKLASGRNLIPVLAKGRNPSEALKTLRWHNDTWFKDKNSESFVSQVQPIYYAMDARVSENPIGETLDGWNREHPEEVPADIGRLAWDDANPMVHSSADQPDRSARAAESEDQRRTSVLE